MSKKLCFDKNTFIIGIVMMIFILLISSYFINFKYNNNNAKLHNLINKKILNIKDKIINNKTRINIEKNTNNNYYDDDDNSSDKVLKEDIINIQSEEEKQELINNHIELVKNKALSDLEEIKQKSLEHELKQELKQELKYELKQELEQDIDTNNKVNFKNNINNRINDRDEIIKYKINDEVQQRDLNVLLNPIYPPLARVERPMFDNLIRMNFGQTTRGSEDTFRLMGYLVNTNKNDVDMGNNIWKLFGRQTYKGSNIGEFYVSPVNDHTSDMKIYLKSEMMPKDKIRDIYALPTEVYFDSPFFSKNAYTINELPKSDFNSNYL
jgi:hypothetical protein